MFPEEEQPFDVIFVDALDPEDGVEFAANLYNNTKFWGSLFNALTQDGILVLQLVLNRRMPEMNTMMESSLSIAKELGNTSILVEYATVINPMAKCPSATKILSPVHDRHESLVFDFLVSRRLC